MRVLLDECVPKRLRRELPGHDVVTVVEMGWSGITNGKLLALAAAQFECFLTVDANIEKQQHVPAIPIAILLVRAVSNDPVTLAAMGPEIQSALSTIQPRQFVTVVAQQTHAARRDA
jgi:predicted nuclease of predicted toxin-antitoxin system